MNNPDVIEMNIKMGTKVDSPEFVAQELYQFLQTDRQSYQVGYPEKVFVKLNQLMPSRVAAAIQKDLDTIYEYADQSKASYYSANFRLINDIFFDNAIRWFG